MAIASVPEGSYRFLAAPGRPFSSGVIADEGFDLVRAVLLRPLPLEEGLEAARRQLEAADRPISAICGLELRSPRPLSRPEFDGFNAAYVRLLRAMGLTEGADPPAARTNVVPAFEGPSAPSLYAFSYTVPGHRPEPGFRLSGVAETRPEATPEDRLRSIVETLEARMAELGVGWESATAVGLYSPTGLSPEAERTLLRSLGGAVLHGIRWFPSRPPVQGLQLEIDVHGVGREIVVRPAATGG